MFVSNELNGFQFNYYIVIYYQIHPICLVELNIIPIDRQKHLPLNFMPVLLQQISHCSFISGLEQAIMVFVIYLHSYPCNIHKELILFIMFF